MAIHGASPIHTVDIGEPDDSVRVCTEDYFKLRV